ncbi:NPSR1 [Mytilus coruscus]|uniref:NPSR1 n=1 Tax=Mytilus coruscus TaxID=42192 RepID=A0A6J8AQH3_MYTCO|nr:NPSR1 [Mytilus coruscus]
MELCTLLPVTGYRKSQSVGTKPQAILETCDKDVQVVPTTTISETQTEKIEEIPEKTHEDKEISCDIIAYDIFYGLRFYCHLRRKKLVIILGQRKKDMENTTTLLAPKQSSVWDNTSTNSSTIFFYQTEQVSFLIVLFTLIVTGNCIVLTVLFLSGKIRSRMNLFMANLACADLMVGIFLVLTDVISKITITWETPDPGCKIVKFLQAMSTYASAFSLVALSIDRLSVVIRPLNRAGNGKSWTLIALAWILYVL